ncbi:MAG: hypothetical protein V4474_03460 [Patescibacteria group bacterium]
MKRTILAGVLLLAPLYTFAAIKPTSIAPAPTVTAAFSYPQMTTLTSMPLITGTSTNLHAPMRLVIVSQEGAQVFSAQVATTSGAWRAVVYPPAVAGYYNMALTTGTTTLAHGQLAVGVMPPRVERDATLGMFDVSDGKLMRFSIRGGPHGTALAQFAFYITPTAASLNTLTLYGFTDAGYSQAIATGTDASVGSAEYDPLSPSVVITPDSPLEVPSYTTYYFELDGDVAASDTAYSVETTLRGDDTPVTPLPLAQALASGFVWSPNTFGTSSPTDDDWLNGAAIPDLYRPFSTERYALPSVTCDLRLSTTSINMPGPVTLTWNSNGVEHATWLGGGTAPLSGSVTYIASSTTTYGLNMWGAAGTAQCTATLYYQTPYVAPPPSGGGTPPPSPYGSFAITPSTGTVPLNVTAAGTVNATKSCGAITYTLGYGDSSTTTINVAKNACKAQTFSLSHRYNAAGTYTARLYAGTFATSTPPLVQSITVTVSPKTAYSPQAMLAGVAASWEVAWSVLRHLFGR